MPWHSFPARSCLLFLIRVNRELKGSVPFAVVGSNTVFEVNGKRVRGRTYPWGVVDIEKPTHCDFTLLRNMLIRTHMQDLKDVTQVGSHGKS